MELFEAREKYLYKVVKHRNKAWLFEIEDVGLTVEDGEIMLKVEFRHLHYDIMPKGQPLDYPIARVEEEFVVIG